MVYREYFLKQIDFANSWYNEHPEKIQPELSKLKLYYLTEHPKTGILEILYTYIDQLDEVLRDQTFVQYNAVIPRFTRKGKKNGNRQVTI